MRLPLIAPLESRDGVSNRDARFTNMLAETNDAGVMIAVKRPGLVNVASPTGTAQGLCEFDGELISIYNATLGKSVATVTETLSASLGSATVLYPDAAIAKKGTIFLSVGGYTGGVFDDKVRYSSDGVTWASYSDGGWGNSIWPPLLCADETYFYAFVLYATNTWRVYRSSTGASWTLTNTITTAVIKLVACWDDGLYYYDGYNAYRSTDGASSFSLMGTNTGTYLFAAPSCVTTIDGVHYIFDINYVIATSTDKINWYNTSIFPLADLVGYTLSGGVFVGGYLFCAGSVSSVVSYVFKIDANTGEYVASPLIADQPSGRMSSYLDLHLMFSDDTYVFLPGDTGVWEIQVQETRTTTITTIAAVAGDEIFDFAQSPL